MSLLGGFVFSVGGDALPAISGGSQRLLSGLCAQPVTRDLVFGTSWQESTDGRAGVLAESSRVLSVPGPLSSRRTLGEGTSRTAFAELEGYGVLLHAELGIEPTPRPSQLLSAGTAVEAPPTLPPADGAGAHVERTQVNNM